MSVFISFCISGFVSSVRSFFLYLVIYSGVSLGVSFWVYVFRSLCIRFGRSFFRDLFIYVVRSFVSYFFMSLFMSLFLSSVRSFAVLCLFVLSLACLYFFSLFRSICISLFSLCISVVSGFVLVISFFRSSVH